MIALRKTAAHADICLFAGLPSTDQLRFHQNFVLSFDSTKRNAKWVLEHITKDSSSGQGSRADAKFFEDTGLEPRFRSRLEDYRNSGYDRGHLVRASACWGLLTTSNMTVIVALQLTVALLFAVSVYPVAATNDAPVSLHVQSSQSVNHESLPE